MDHNDTFPAPELPPGIRHRAFSSTPESPFPPAGAEALPWLLEWAQTGAIAAVSVLRDRDDLGTFVVGLGDGDLLHHLHIDDEWFADDECKEELGLVLTGFATDFRMYAAVLISSGWIVELPKAAALRADEHGPRGEAVTCFGVDEKSSVSSLARMSRNERRSPTIGTWKQTRPWTVQGGDLMAPVQIALMENARKAQLYAASGSTVVAVNATLNEFGYHLYAFEGRCPSDRELQAAAAEGRAFSLACLVKERGLYLVESWTDPDGTGEFKTQLFWASPNFEAAITEENAGGTPIEWVWL